MKKKILTLKKKTIALLSDAKAQQIKGGVAYTTSNSDCTHLFCCHSECGCPDTENAEDEECYDDPPGTGGYTDSNCGTCLTIPQNSCHTCVPCAV